MVECIGACMLCIQMPSAHADIKIFTHLEDDFVFASMHTFLFKYCNWNKILKMNNGHTIGGENGKNVRYQVRMDDRYTSTRYQVPVQLVHHTHMVGTGTLLVHSHDFAFPPTALGESLRDDAENGKLSIPVPNPSETSSLKMMKRGTYRKRRR